MLLLTALCAFAAAGCSSGSDASLAKVHFQRTTIPASQGGSDNSGNSTSGGQSVTDPHDPAFAADKLRLVDPCGLLDTNTLSGLGTPGDNVPSGIDECDNDMKDSSGADLQVMVTIGEALDVQRVSGQLAGMPVAEDKASSECTDKIVTQTNPTIGIAVEASIKGDSCTPARKLAQAVIERIRSNPPQRANTNGSLAVIDPCGTVDDPTAATAIGGQPQKSYQSLFKCDWQGTTSYDLTVTFSVGEDPKDDTTLGTPQPVDLGNGVSAYQLLTTDVYPSCEIKWITRQTGSDGSGEFVDVEFDNVEKQQVDVCSKALAVAKVVATKVPKPS